MKQDPVPRESIASKVRKLLEILDARERRQLFILFAVTLVMAFAQVVGIASIMPFVGLLADPNMASENWLLRSLYDASGFDDTRSFTFAIGLLVLLVFTLSNALSALAVWMMFQFAQSWQHNLSMRLLTRYLNEPYTFFLERNSSVLNHRIQAEVPWVVNAVALPILQMLTRACLAGAILILLIVVNPILALIIGGAIGGSYFAIYMLIKKRQERLGGERFRAQAQKFKTATEALSSIKELRILGREAELHRRFSENSLITARNTAKHDIAAELPRYLIETLGLGAIILIALYMLAVGNNIAGILPVLSLYAIAGYRMLPALQLIYHGAAYVRFGVPALDAVHHDLTSEGPPTTALILAETEPAKRDAIRFEREIRLENVSYRYPATETDVLKDVSITVPKNTSAAFVGSTGAGKTTLADIVLGLLTPQEGSLSVDGRTITEADLVSWRKLLGYVPQGIFLSDDTIANNIAFGLPPSAVDPDAVQRAADAAQASEFINRLPNGYDTLIGERGIRLSGGQRQRIGIARALYHDPEVLILDEATSALDGLTENAVMDAIGALGRSKTIIVIAHRLATVEECDLIYFLEGGRVSAAGRFDEVLQASPQFRQMARVFDTTVEATRGS